jgi:hypothetical protein
MSISYLSEIFWVLHGIFAGFCLSLPSTCLQTFIFFQFDLVKEFANGGLQDQGMISCMLSLFFSPGDFLISTCWQGVGLPQTGLSLTQVDYKSVFSVPQIISLILESSG